MFKLIIMEKICKNKKPVSLNDLGTFIKLICLDYKPKNNKELSELISENFNVICLESDIIFYENLDSSSNLIKEDFELEARRTKYSHNY